MSINLLDLMKGAIGGKVVGQVAGLLGVDEGSANKMVGGALPALLAGFIGKASTDEGAEQLGAVLDQADGTILDNIGDILGGADGGSDRLQEMGNGLIGGLFGDKVEGILDLLAGVSGIDKAKSGSFLGMIAPIIFSLLGKQKKGLGLDAGGFAKLLLGQKDLLKGVLPPGFANVLGLSGFEGDTDVAGAVGNLKDTVVNAATEKVEDVKDATSSAVGVAADKVGDVKDAVAGTAASVASTAGKTTEAAVKSGGGLMKFLFPLIILAAIGFCVWKFVLPKLSGGDSVNVPIPAVTEITPANALTTMTGVIASAKSTLSGVKDVDSARAAIPEIEGITKSVGAVGNLMAGLPVPVKKQIQNVLEDSAPKIRKLVNKAFSIPGVKAILEPKLNDLFSQLEKFAP